MLPEKTNNILSRAIPQSDPNHFRRRSAENAEAVKIFVLGYDHVSVLLRVLPDRLVGSAQQAHIGYVNRAVIRTRKLSDEARCEIFVKE
jgi:hypothetical protein